MQYYQYQPPFSAVEKLHAINLLKKCDIGFVARRYHCSVRSIWRWKARYDGSIDSLENHSHAPKTPNPRRQSDEEIKHIRDLVRRNPCAGLNELYGKLRTHYDYMRNPVTLYRFLRRIGYFGKVKRKPYVPKPYDTPRQIGEKMQLDVKVVPSACKCSNLPFDKRYYQYTIIDEASRQRFIYPYEEQCARNTVDFVRRAINFFGYVPKIIQTDNGQEFTYIVQTKDDRLHPLDSLCKEYGIIHKTIKPRTPRHNGKVERSHRNDNERFYRYLKFYSLEDLKKQMRAYLYRSNRIPSSALSWLSPLEKRKELLISS